MPITSQQRWQCKLQIHTSMKMKMMMIMHGGCITEDWKLVNDKVAG